MDISVSTRSRLAIHGSAPVRRTPFPAWPVNDQRIEQAVLAVLRSGHWWQSGGGWAERLEEWLATYHGVNDCIAVANGTLALELSFRALDIGAGDEVLVPAITFFSTASAVHAVGATAIPVDVLPDTLCIDTSDATRKLTARTRAVVPVHLAGQPADLDAVRALADEAGLFVIEDAAQALGAQWKGTRIGSFGIAATLSFQAAKLLPGGEGGAVLIRDNPRLAQRIRLLANCGRDRGSPSYEHVEIATNARISELHSALLLSQTDRLDELHQRRAAAADRLCTELVERGLATPMRVDPRVTSMPWYIFAFRPSDAALSRMTNVEYASALTAEGIPAARMFPPFHRVPAFAGLDSADARCPVADDGAAAMVWMHHRLLLDGDEGVSDIVDAIRKIDEFCTSHRK